MIKKIKNYGLLPDLRSEEEKSKDFIFGADNGIYKQILMPDSNWYDDPIVVAKQHGVYLETMGCVSFSLSGVAEDVFNRKIALNQLCQEDLDWLKEKGYFDENGRINFSERYLAKMSGTTRDGNSLWKVVDTARHYGFIPYKLWPFPTEQRTPVFGWDDFYKIISQELIDLGIEFAKRFNIQYELVDTWDHALLRNSLQFSTVQVTGNAWPRQINDIFPKTDGRLNHAFRSIYEDFTNQLRYAQDTYQDWDNKEVPGAYYKRLAWDYIYGRTGYILYFTSKNEEINLLSQKVMEYLKQNENKLVQNTGDGSIGIIVGGKVKVTTPARAGLLALTALIRQGGGGGVTQEMWDAMPKEVF